MALNESNRKYLDSLSSGKSSFVSDLPKFANIGARQLVGSLGTVPEAIGAATGRPQLQQSGQAFRQRQDRVIQEEVVPTLSKEGKKVFSAGIEDVFKGDVGVGKFVLGKSAQFLPGTLGGGLVGAGIRSAVPVLSRGAAFAAGEALVTAPSGASRQAAEIDNATGKQLLETSKTYRSAYAQHAGKPENVREALARAAVKAEALPTGGLSAAAATIAGSVLAGRFTKGGAGGVFGDGAEKAAGIIKGAGQGARREAVQEAAQSFLESIAGDVVTSNFTDPSAAKLDNLLKNAALSAAEGALIGSSLGASVGAVQGRLNKMTADRIERAEKEVGKAQPIEKPAATRADGTQAPAQPPTAAEAQEIEQAREVVQENVLQAAKSQADVDTLDGKVKPAQQAKPLSEMGRIELIEAAKSAGIQHKGISSERLRENIQVANDAVAGVKSPAVEQFNLNRELDAIGETIGTQVPKKLRKQIITAFTGVDNVQDKLAILEALQDGNRRTKSIAVEDTFTEYRRILEEQAAQQEVTPEVQQAAAEEVVPLEEQDDLTAPTAGSVEPVSPDVPVQQESLPVQEAVASQESLQEQQSGFSLPEFKSILPSTTPQRDQSLGELVAGASGIQTEAVEKLPGLIGKRNIPLLEFKQEQAQSVQPGAAVLEAPKALQAPQVQEAPKKPAAVRKEKVSKLDRPATTEERILEAASIEDVSKILEEEQISGEALTAEQESEVVKLAERHPEIVERYIRIGAAKGWSNDKVLSKIRENVPAQEKTEAVNPISESEQRRRNIETAQDVVNRKKVDAEFEAMVDSALDAYFSGSTKQAAATELSDLPDVTAEPSSDLRTSGKKISADEIRSSIAKILNSNSIDIKVITSVKSLPPSARKYLESKGLEDTARGVFIPGKTAKTDSIYVIADNITNIQEATFVTLHEAVHRGLRKVFGAKLSAAMDQVYAANAAVKLLVDARVQETKESKQVATEEVLADMAREGAVRNLKMWDRVVKYINDWISRVLRVPVKLTNRQVEELVSGAQSIGLEADVEAVGNAFPGKISDIRTSLRFDQGPAQAMDKIEGVLSDTKEFVESRVPAVTGWLHRSNMYFSTGSHITEFYGRLLGGRFKDLLANWQSALGRTSAMVSKMNKDVSLNVKRIDTLSDKPQSQKALYQLMGESTRLGIYPDRPFEDQTWLKPSDRAAYNNLKDLYKKPGVSQVYDDLLSHTRRDFDMSYASLLRTMGFMFEAPRELWSSIDPLKSMSEASDVRESGEADVKAMEAWLSKDVGSDAANAFKSMKEFRAARLRGPYFHLGRYGDYFVRYRVVDPIAVQEAMDESNQFSAFEYQKGSSIMNRFEKESQWNTQTGLLRKLQESGAVEGVEIGKVEENLSALDSTSPSFMQNMLTRVDADTRINQDQKSQTKELMRRIFVEMMPEVSGGKQLARRKGVPGYDVDMRRSFVKKASATAYLVAHNTVRPEVMESIKEMRFELNKLRSDPTQDVKRVDLAHNVFNHLKRRLDNSMQPLDTPMLDKFSSLGYSMFLASSVPYILTNLLQPMQVGLPVIGAKHGFTKTASEMFKSSKKAAGMIKDSIQKGWSDAKSWTGILDAHIVIDRSELTPGERKAMHAFVDSGNLEFTQAHGLGRIERGEAEGWNTVAKTFGAASHYSEALNRISVGLTAFNLEMQKLKDSGLSEEEKINKAVAYGMNSIVNTQFNYDPENRAIAFSKRGIFGELTPLFTGFMQFNVQMLQLLSSLVTQAFSNSSVERSGALRALGGLTATTILLAGAMGLPGVSLLAGAYGSLAGDDDDPRDFRADALGFLSDLVGADAANVIAHGALDRATGGTFSTRLSLADIVPFSQFLSDRRNISDKLESGSLAMLGPSVGAAANVLQGAEKFLDGDIYKGMAMMLPAALQGPVKAADLLQNGFTTSKGSSLPIRSDGWDVFLQALNITPAVKTELQRNARSFSLRDSLLDTRKTELSRRMADALEKGDFDAIQSIGAEMTEFQLKNPDRGNFDPDRILKQRLKKLDTAVASGTGVTADPRDMSVLLQMLQGSTTTNLKERLNNELQLR